MNLEFVESRRDVADNRSWRPPFDWSIAYENDHWWDGTPNGVSEPWFVQVLEDSVEVARVEFDNPGGINPNYTNVPTVGDERLEVQYIEVATAARVTRSLPG